MQINNTIDYCLELNFFQLQDFAGRNYQKLYNHLKTNTPQPGKALVPLILTCIASDGRLEKEEWDFIVSFIGGFSYNEALEKASKLYSDEARQLAKRFLYGFPTLDLREAFVNLCIAVLCVDRRFKQSELDFLQSIIL